MKLRSCCDASMLTLGVAAFFGFAGILAGYPGSAFGQETAAGYYRGGLAARASGNFAHAVKLFEKASAIDPANTDILIQLGSVYGIEKRYGDAVAVYRKVLGLVPSSLDAKLGIARVASWQGKYQLAADAARRILTQNPGNGEAAALLGRISYFQGRLDQAETHLRQALKANPKDPELIISLGDVLFAAQRYRDAKSQYTAALALAPHMPLAITRAKRTPPPRKQTGPRRAAKRVHRRAAPPAFNWELVGGYIYSSFSRVKRKSWREAFVHAIHAIDAKTKVHARVERSQRFDRTDVHLEAGIARRLSDPYHAYFTFGATPSPDFLPRLRARAGGSARLHKGTRQFGATVLTFEGNWSNYATGDVFTFKPGFDQYLFSGRVWLTGQFINILDENDMWLKGWLGRVTWQVTDAVRLFAGAANAPETVAGGTVDTRAYFGGLLWRINPALAVRLDVAEEDRQNAYIRRVISASVMIKF